MKQDGSSKTEDTDKPIKESSSLFYTLIDKLNMVLFHAMFLFLLQHVVLTSGRAVLGAHQHPRHSLALDKAALLRFKGGITKDPFSTLANWNDSTHVCRFNGVRCNRNDHRVSELIINESQLVGLLSPFLSNLTGLRILWIVNCHLFGSIPHQFSSLKRLESLRLDGNNLYGPIPESLFLIPYLNTILLSDNNLNGTLSPAFFSNCSSSLLVLDVSKNSISGGIPVEIGNCVNLLSLSLDHNQFNGLLPHSLTNTSLLNLDLEYNHFKGLLPVEIIASLPHLLYLHLSYNNMESHNGNTDLSPFFNATKNCTHLEELQLAGMDLGGRLPSSIGKVLGVNLTVLLLQENRIVGSVPQSLSNFSLLRTLNLSSNLMTETISDQMSVLPKLEQLFLSHNRFSSKIPEVWVKFPSLGLLDLSHNNFFGEIPESIRNLSRLNYLFLNNNNLSGKIPSTLASCTALLKIDLSHNRLSGKIPPAISSLGGIKIFINFSHNQLEGPLPIELSKLVDVQEMDFSSNNLTGEIVTQISKCIAVRLINFSHNSLENKLPDIFDELKNLEIFDVSSNHLSGMIPQSLIRSQTLKYLNLSFNDFEGMIPSGGVFSTLTKASFLQNPRLCGRVPGIRPCPHKRHLFRSRMFLVLFAVVIFVSAFFSTICCVIGFRRLKILIASKKNEAARRKPRAPELIHNFPRITYRELSEATAGFDDQRLVGSGSYGSVYKGVLSDGTAVAVKVLHVQSGNSTKSFNRECQVLKRIRHRNLIRIITACSLPDFKALVLPYMANGSLDSRLYPHSGTSLGSGSSDLSLLQRVNICSDIAEGTAYLHHHSPVRVIHCDLKPSNVLLNDDMTALVSDFGIARLVMTAAGGNNAAAVENMGNSTANMLAGSIGYIAPEYGFGSITSTKGDVYSFGILVLEMVTRKRPTDDMFVGGLSLHKWVKSHYHGRVERVVDSSLLRASKDEPPEVKKMWEVAIGELIELGLLCTQESPSTRPTMLDAADDLDRLKRYLFGDTTATFASSLGISSSTLGDD